MVGYGYQMKIHYRQSGLWLDTRETEEGGPSAQNQGNTPPRGRPARRAGRALQRPEHEPERGCDRDPGDVPAGDGGRLVDQRSREPGERVAFERRTPNGACV